MTNQDIQDAIGNAAFALRGRTYMENGRVENLQIVRDKGVCSADAVVRGANDDYSVSFSYDETHHVLTDCDCDCPQFARTGHPCKHVAAVMYAAQGKKAKTAEPFWGDADKLAKMERIWQERLEAMQAEAERLKKQSYISRLVHGAQQTRLSHFRAVQDEGKVRLYPVIYPQDGMLALELKIGRDKLYMVRNLFTFADRMFRHERFSYGKELTFGHTLSEIDERDHQLASYLIVLSEASERQRTTMCVGGAAMDHIMRLLLGREVYCRKESGDVVRIDVVQGGVDMALALEKEANGATLRVRAENVLLGENGAYMFTPSSVRCAFEADFERASGLLQVARDYPEGISVGEDELGALCAQVIAPSGATIVRGREWIANNTPMSMVPRFFVDMDTDGEANARLRCRIVYDYGVEQLSPKQENPHIRRDTLLEEAVQEAVRAIFPQKLESGEYAFSGSDDEHFALLTERLPGLEKFGEVMISDRLSRMNVRTARTISFGMTRQGTKLLVKADFGGLTQEELDAAYTAYRLKRRYVRLKSGAFLSGEALDQAAQAAQLTQSLDATAEELENGADLPLARAMYLEEAVKARTSVKLNAPGELEDWVDRLARVQRTEVEQPRTLAAQLRAYQQSGLCWMSALSDAGFCGILADDMGLGKTIQALALLLREQERGNRVRALVVCPASLQLNWLNEAKKFAPTLKSAVLLGDANRRATMIADEQTELLITSYDQVRRDAAAYADVELTHVLLDEAQYIKNAASQAAKAVKTLRTAHRFAMTGTPIENRLSELWSIFDFLMPGYLMTYKKFKERFEAPIVKEADERARANLHLMVAPFILRRMKQDVLTELPEKVETVMTCAMTDEQEKLYHAYAKRLMDETENMADPTERMKVLAGLTRLRQLCCDPRLCLEGYAGGSGKLDQVIELVEDMASAGHKMLLFSQFTSMLDLLEKELADRGIGSIKLTGATDKLERMQMVETFNKGDIPVFLISLKAGGTGLNLTGADVVIHYDPWWNTAAQNQATDRAYRIGQTRGVQVISLITQGTVEERILLIQQEKRALSDGILLGEETLFTLDSGTIRDILKG